MVRRWIVWRIRKRWNILEVSDRKYLGRIYLGMHLCNKINMSCLKVSTYGGVVLKIERYKHPNLVFL